MYKYIKIFLFFFSPAFSQIYAPMSSRTFELIVDDICSYKLSNSDFIYVEPCEKDNVCEEIISNLGIYYPQIGICRKNVQEEILVENDCEKIDDCYTGLKCVNKKCTLEENDSPVYLYNSYHYCPDNLIYIIDTGKCEKRADHQMNGLCYLKSDAGSMYAEPDYMKICGEILLDTAEKNYEHLKTKLNTIGSVEDGKFVDNQLACKSGFTLEFYPDMTITQAGSSTYYQKYEKCVTFDGIEYKKGGNCKIKYIIDKKNYVYDVDKTDISGKGTFCSNFKFIETKLDLFKQYVDKLNELGDECTKNKFFDEPFTCRNDELRKLNYFYINTEEYLLYKNEDEVTEFLLQQKYPSYKVNFTKTDKGEYLRNIFICVLILFLL